MGQSGSAQIETLTHTQQASPLPVKKAPPPRPASPPPRPAPIQRTPSYVIPENLVMPGGILPKKKLKPVSQEISKIYPEFAEIFPSRDDDEDWSNSLDVSMETSSSGDSEKENSARTKENILESNSKEIVEASTLPRTSKDSHMTGSQQVVGGSQNGHQGTHANVGLKRSNSLDRTPASALGKGHRRNQSVTTRSLMNEQNTIFEDPREHLYDHWRKDPYTNPLPSVVSLPVKNNFDIDISYNMTYAQLAEYRRKTNLEELEKSTGINLNQLSEELNSSKEVSPFDRQFLRASSRSTSTASSDAGVSKRKKKRAPPPPQSASNGDLNSEPPADYDVDDLSPRSLPERLYLRKSSISSMISTTSSKARMAPPPPNASTSSSITTLPSKAVQNNVSAITTKVDTLPEKMESSSDKTKESPEQDAIDKLDALINLPESPDNTGTEQKSNTVENVNTDSNESINKADDTNAEMLSVTDSESPNKEDNTCAEDRLNSLVQKQDTDDESENEKPKLSPPSEKPKSPQDLFKEQLAKAYEERQERNKLLLEKKKQKQDTAQLSEQKQEEAVNLLKKMSRDLDKKWLAEFRHTSSTGEEQTSDKEMDEEASESSSLRIFSDEWTPEHDLDSDDDIDDRIVTNLTKTTPEGFKSSIIPAKVRDLKGQEKKKNGKYIRRKSDSSGDDKHRYGSIRKFKYNIRKSVQNAFGSISRASGKLLKTKSQDLLDESEDPTSSSNWQLAPEKEVDSTNNGKTRKDSQGITRASNYEVEEASEDESEDSDEELEDPEDERLKESSGQMKQMGLAYVTGHKQVVLLPEFETVRLDKKGNIIDSVDEENNWAPKIFKKKKKFTYASTIRQKEKEKIDEMVSEKIREKEQQIEFERRRQFEMEKEFHRLRALENQEQLQRLQSAHMQQQLHALQQQQLHALQQQQQQQQAFGGMSLSAPALPAPNGMQDLNGFGTNMLNPAGYGQHQAIAPVSVMGQSMASASFPQNVNMPFMNPPNMNGNLSNMGSYDISYLSNVMKMNGIQPPSTTQQWAYLLSSVNIPSAPFEVLQGKTMSVGGAGPGPDLSTVFPATSFEGAQAEYCQKRQLMDYLPKGSIDPREQSKYTGFLDEFQRGAKTERLQELQPQPPLSEKPKLKSNPVYYSSDEDDLTNGLSPARTSMVACIKVGDHREIPMVAKSKSCDINSNTHTEALMVNGHVGNSHGASNKVYGPLGFKPVSFISNSNVCFSHL
ncbi:uncharacterized protein LOC121380535 isoform X2 [Gigantopelta aegis]|uniref:uncharacterized protein LOC121380535 isoform X2 n=1 Tax=Gigantopelta aegis TaxID=1735272 RepID=UPI001B88D37E|nr:uncharacterized protein LOC121380535 isoform X2 [Gigantopelta aegis]